VDTLGPDHRLLAVIYQFRARAYFAAVYPNLGDREAALKSGRLYLETAQQILESSSDSGAREMAKSAH
jgi:hypothetical protein